MIIGNLSHIESSGRSRSEIMKCQSRGKDDWIENCRKGMVLVLQTRPKTFNQNMSLKLKHITLSQTCPEVSSSHQFLICLLLMCTIHIQPQIFWIKQTTNLRIEASKLSLSSTGPMHNNLSFLLG